MYQRAARVPYLVVLACLAFPAILGAARAQGITVSPVIVEMPPGQMATVLTIGNQSDREIAFQIRAFAWQQSRAGEDQLTPTDELQSRNQVDVEKPDGRRCTVSFDYRYTTGEIPTLGPLPRRGTKP